MFPTVARFGRPLGVVAVVALATAACGSSSSPTASPTTAAGGGGTATTAASSGAPNRITVSESEYHIQLSPDTLHPGQYVIAVNNTGKVTHDLVVNGPGVQAQRSPFLAPGQSATMTVTLQSGTYELYCGVDGHKDLGMDLHIQVS